MSDLATRFWSRVTKNPDDGCWEWCGYTNANGYGRVSANGNPGALTHRVAWELQVGPIPDGLLVLHRCDNPRCVRAEADLGKSHLFLGTHLVNVRDCMAKGRKRSRVLIGRRDEILARFASGETMTNIAQSLGVHYMSVWRVVRRGAPLAPPKPRPPRKGPCRGEASPRAKLTEDAVREIRSARAAGVPLAALTARFGVDKALVSRIARRLVWRHVA